MSFCLRRSRRLVSALFLGWLLPLAALAARPAPQSINGVPRYTIYEPEMIGASSGIGGFACDRLGRLVMTSGSSLIAFDGNHWQTYLPSPAVIQQFGTGGLTLQAVVLGPDDALYCSANLGLFSVEFGADGRFDLHPLPVPAGIPPARLQNLHHARAEGGMVYFQGANQLVQLDTGTGTLQLLTDGVANIASFLPGRRHLYLFDVEGRAFVHRRGQLWDQITQENQAVYSEGIRTAVEWLPEGILVGPDASGLFSLDETGFEAWPSEIHELESHRVIAMEPVSEEHLAVAVDAAGIFILNREGDVVQFLSRTLDHRFGNVRQMRYLGNGVLWILTETSLARIQILRPLTEFSILLPYARNHPRILWHRGELHLTTDEKLVRAERFRGGALKGFTRLAPERDGRVTSALSTAEGLLVSTLKEIYLLRDDGTTETVADLPQVTLLLQSESDPDLVLAATGGAYHLLQRIAGRWQASGLSQPADGPCFVGVTTPDAFWVENGAGRATRLWLENGQLKKTLFDTRDGLGPDWVNLWKIDQHLYLGQVNFAAHGTWDPVGKTIGPVTSPVLRQVYAQPFAITRPGVDSFGNIWVPTSSIHPIMRRQPDGSYRRDLDTLAPIRNISLVRIYAAPEGVVWLTGINRIFRFDPSYVTPAPPLPETVLYQVDPGRQHPILLGPGATSAAEPLTLKYQDNTVQFHLTTPTVDQDFSAGHQYFLDGRSNSWTALPASETLLLSNLREGDYRIRFRPIFEGGKLGDEVSFTFTILPPFVRTPLAYALYAFGFAAIILLAVVSTRLLGEKKNQILQRLVSVRTRELELSNEELARAVARAESSTQAKSTFLRNVSHEMRTPLNAIIGPASLLQAELKEEHSRSLVELINKSADHLLKMIEEIIDFAALDRPPDTGRPQPFNLHTLMEDLSNEFLERAKEKNLHFRTHVDPALNFFWECDFTALRKALRLLLENAIKFTETGTIEFSAFSCEVGTQRYRLCFEVSDTGIGIPEEQRMAIFEPFHQIESPRRGKPAGTGIGLSVCQQLIHSLDGDLSVESQVDKGSTFRITLPATPVASSADREADNHKSGAGDS